MNKIVRLGTAKTYNGRSFSIFCKISIVDGKLSISGVEGPLPSGNAIGSCGQIDMHLKPEDIIPAPGWTAELIQEFLQVWARWHLNDMRAGTQKQEDFLRTQTFPDDRRGNHYTWAKEILAAAGLDPDPETGYKYGSAWLKEELPKDVIEFLEGLPETDKQPAWV